MATGDIIGWINSDDYYETNIFSTVMNEFANPKVQWIIGDLRTFTTHTGQYVQIRSAPITYTGLLKNPDIVDPASTVVGIY